jgi:hypothetical protein
MHIPVGSRSVIGGFISFRQSRFTPDYGYGKSGKMRLTCSDERHEFWHFVMSIGRRVRACTRLLEAAKALTTRDHVRGISGPSTLFNMFSYAFARPVDESYC